MKLIKFLVLALGVLAFASCGGDDTPTKKKPMGSIILASDNNSYEVNSPITFTITDNLGNDRTAEAIILDKTNDYVEVPNPFTPTSDGEYQFIASVGNMIAPTIKVNVVPTIPALPTDANPTNTSFHHRILLVEHTGNSCGNCPKMMTALKEIAETESLHNRYYEAMAHSYSPADPAYSGAAGSISSHYGVNEYPKLTYNFYHTKPSDPNKADIINQIVSLWKADGADAGIAASASFATSSVVVNIEVKAAIENDYRVTAWLLEDNIYAAQTNATEDWMNIHNNAIRQRIDSNDITGVDLGNIAAGEKRATAVTLKISRTDWVRDNMKVLVITSAKNAKGKFEVANVAICPIGGSVTYEYK